MNFLQKTLRPSLISMTYQLIVVFGFFTNAGLAKAKASDWNWTQSPSTENWKAFFQFTDLERGQEWKALEKKGNSFEALSWEWKLAWVRSCTYSSTQDCSKIIQLGLFDKALVVRAEAATRLGQRFAGSGHKPAIRILRKAYGIQQNTRSKEPMFVQYRILQALNQIGGEGRSVGKQLSMNSEGLHKYWTRIASAK